MARILAYTSPARGDLYPIVPVLAELLARGHDIVVRTLSSGVPQMHDLGFRASAIAAEIEAIRHDDYQARTPTAAIKRSLRVFARRAPHEQIDLRAAIEMEAPDVVLVDFNCWGAAAVAESAGVAWGRWCSYPLPLPSRDAPPFGPGLSPAHGPLGHLRDRVVGPLIIGGFERIILPELNEVRGREGLAPLRSVTDIATSTPLLLSMTAEPFEYPRSDWPTSVRLIGPCAWEPASAPPAWLADVDRPIVLVTSSSEFQDDGLLVRSALQQLADEPVHVVATVPAHSVADFPLPANAHVERFVPHATILTRAVCAVTHGGMGATQKALAHGVPVCVVPFGRDQSEVARRVETSGSGTRLPKRKLRGRNSGALREAVAAATDCAAGARKVAAAFAQAGNGPAGADAVEGTLLRE